MIEKTTNLDTTVIPAKYSFLQEIGIPINAALMIFWVAASFLYAITIGRKRGPVLLMSTYAGLAVATVFSKINFSEFAVLGNFQSNVLFDLVVFLIVVVMALVAFVKTINRNISIHRRKNGMIILAFLEMGAFLASLGSLVPPDMQKQITSFAGVLFTTPWTLLMWLGLPLLVLLIGEYGHREV